VFEGGDLARLDAEDLEERDEEALRLRLLVVGEAPVLREARRVPADVVPALPVACIHERRAYQHRRGFVKCAKLTPLTTPLTSPSRGTSNEKDTVGF